VASDLEFGSMGLQVLMEGSLDGMSLLVRFFMAAGLLEHGQFLLIVCAIFVEIVLNVVKIGVHFSEALNNVSDLRLLFLEFGLKLLESLLVIELDLEVLIWGHGVFTIDLDEVVLLLLDILSLQFLQIGVDFAEVLDNLHDLLLGGIEFGLEFLYSLGSLLLRLDLGVSMKLSGGLFTSLDTGFSGRCDLLESFLLGDEFLLLHGLLLELALLLILLLGLLFFFEVEDVVR